MKIISILQEMPKLEENKNGYHHLYYPMVYKFFVLGAKK